MPLGELDAVLAAGVPRVTAEQRAAELTEREESFRLRFATE